AYKESASIGTKVYVACGGVFAGSIIISDEIKPDSKGAIAGLKEKGVEKTVMLTGDNPVIAKEIAGELGIDEVYGGLLPQEKVEKLEALNTQKKEKGRLAFVGDGIND
ncbi:HAD family hydrolase, partial [Treponema sp. R6D11]